MQKYRFLDHIGEVEFNAYGKDEKEAIENAFCAIRDTMFKKTRIKPNKKIVIKQNGYDKNDTIWKFLEKIIEIIYTKRIFPIKLKIRELRDNYIEGLLFYVEDVSYQIDEIKAISPSNLFIKKKNNRYILHVIADV